MQQVRAIPLGVVDQTRAIAPRDHAGFNIAHTHAHAYPHCLASHVDKLWNGPRLPKRRGKHADQRTQTLTATALGRAPRRSYGRRKCGAKAPRIKPLPWVRVCTRASRAMPAARVERARIMAREQPT